MICASRGFRMKPAVPMLCARERVSVQLGLVCTSAGLRLFAVMDSGVVGEELSEWRVIFLILVDLTILVYILHFRRKNSVNLYSEVSLVNRRALGCCCCAHQT